MSSLRRIWPILAAAAAVAALAGCGGGGDGDQTNAQATTTSASAACGTPQAKAKDESDLARPPLDKAKVYEVALRTNKGTFSIQLDQEQSPHATAAFVALARDGYFDCTTFHRIVPNFVIQGGDPTATGTGGPGFSTVDPPPSDARYKHGVVAMAKTQAEPPGTAGSQFFVVTGADVGLPPDYAIIGQVTKGLDVVDAIGKLGDATTQQPTETVSVEKATVSES